MTLTLQRAFLLVAFGGTLMLGCTQGEKPSNSTPAAGCPADCSKECPEEEAATETTEQAAAEDTGAAADTAESLTAALADSSAEARANAARALGAMGAAAKPAVPELTALLADEDATVRRQAVQALHAIKPGPDVMIPLFTKAMQDSDPGVQLRVLRSLAEAGEAAVPGLIEALKNDDVAYWACVVLRDIGPAAKAAVPALTERLKAPQEEIRMQAVLALGAMGEAAQPAVPEIAATLSDQHMAAASTFVLGELGAIPADAEEVIRANAKSEDSALRTVSLWALARVHPEDKEVRREATKELVTRLKDENPHVRSIAARGLAALPPAPEIEMSIWEEALKDADPATVRMALDAVASIGAPAVPQLVEVLEKYDGLHVEVVYILGQMGPEAAAATDALAKLVMAEDLHLATEAILALGKIGPGAKDAVPALCAALEEDDETNAHAIIFALGSIGPDAAKAEPQVLKAMESEDKALAVIAARTYVEIQPSVTPEAAAKALPIMAAGLADPLPETRKAAADGLAILGPLAKEAVPALEKASTDNVKSVRDAAADALKAIQ